MGLICLFSASAAQGDFINGSFEDGNFNGWSTLGSCFVIGGVGGGPTDGSYQSLLLTFGNGQDIRPATPLELVQFTGVDFTTVVDFFAQNGLFLQGSAIAQSFSASAGQVLSFDWNFLTNEDRLLYGGDFAFVTITPLGETTQLANAITTVIPSQTRVDHETGFQTFTRLIPAAGEYRIAIGLADVIPVVGFPPYGLFDYDSALLVDNVRLSAVPEPPTFTLVSLGLASIVAIYQRRRPNLDRGPSFSIAQKKER
jgi:hypothetical protein